MVARRKQPVRTPTLSQPRAFLWGLSIVGGIVLFFLLHLPPGIRPPALAFYGIAVCLTAAILLGRPLATLILSWTLIGAIASLALIIWTQ